MARNSGEKAPKEGHEGGLGVGLDARVRDVAEGRREGAEAADLDDDLFRLASSSPGDGCERVDGCDDEG
jgi:hypothetical protein